MKLPKQLLLTTVGLLAVTIPLVIAIAAARDVVVRSSDDLRKIRLTLTRLKPLHEKQEKPKPGEWLAEHKESGQSFLQYNRSRPVRFTAARDKIFVQPIGTFTKRQQELVEISSDFLSIYFDCPVKILKNIDLADIPDAAKRTHPRWGDRQILSTHILDKVLAPKLPADAAALIAFTSSDLWPGENWNFVFGQASLRNRVGVWSFYRNGKTEGTDEEFKVCLKRTLKVATHETGHMLSMNHCTAYRCNMQGSNSLPESDRQPLYLCPECHAKIMLATGCNPEIRFEKLADFFKKHEFASEEKQYRKFLARIR